MAVVSVNSVAASKVKPQPEYGESESLAQGSETAPPLQEIVIPNGEIEKIIVKYFGKDARTAVAIAKAESGLTSNAFHVNQDGSVDIGVFQINSCHGQDPEKLKNPDFNIRYAYELYSKSGWNPWSAYKNGSYLKHL